MSIDPRRALAALLLGFLASLGASSGCTAAHTCGPACESAGAEPATGAAAQTATSTAASPQSATLAATAQEPLPAGEAALAFETAWKAIYDTHFDPDFNGVDWVALHDEIGRAHV